MPSPLPRQVQWSLFARASPLAAAFPCVTVRSAPAIVFSGPAQRSLALRPARSPSHQRDPLHRRLRRLRYLRRRFDCYRVERTSSRVGLSPTVNQRFSRRTRNGGASRDRTDDLIVANDVVLRYSALIPQDLQAKHPLRTAIYWNMFGT